MAITNQERIGKALDLLRQGLQPFIERELQNQYYASGATNGRTRSRSRPMTPTGCSIRRPGCSMLCPPRSRPTQIERMKIELLRVRFDEQVRGEKRKAGGSLIEAAASGMLKPWREVVTPHPDVASGRYQQAEFAADLWQVHLGEGSDEYRDPVEFFRRTYLTESLKRLLVGAVERLSGKGGDPVVQLQTNFGGGKTHSMLALYHLFSGHSPAALPGVDTVLAEAERDRVAAGAAGGAGRQQTLARQPDGQARRHSGAHPVG
jgi:hypothetical protein